MPAPINAKEHLRGPILRAVSRSFYLSIRLLPVKLRDPIALAYLLARATDTLADTAEIETALRLHSLGKLAALIQTGGTAESGAFLMDFAKQQSNPGERKLIEAIPVCLAWLQSMPEADRADIREVLARITEGQMLDLQRFGNSERIAALTNAGDLERYTYLVAGCVGEFWTKVCFRYLPEFSARPVAEMLSLGKEYGQGLQLVNILRDAGSDLRAGRCYLPEEELRRHGITPDDLRADPRAAWPIAQTWLRRAEQGMSAGIEYSCAVRPWRVRLATALPALIGARTLALLRLAGPRAFTERIKVPRAEVRRITFGALRTLARPRSLRRAFARLSG